MIIFKNQTCTVNDGFVLRVKPVCTYPSLGSSRFRQISLIQISHGLLSIWITQIVCLKGKTRAVLRDDLPWFLPLTSRWKTGNKCSRFLLALFCTWRWMTDGVVLAVYTWFSIASFWSNVLSSKWRLPSFDQIYSQISTQGII